MQKQKIIFTKEQLNELIANLDITKDPKMQKIIELCRVQHMTLMDAIKFIDNENKKDCACSQ